MSSIRLVRPRCFLLASAALTSFAAARSACRRGAAGPRAAAAGRGVARPIPQTGKAGGPGRAEPTPRSIAQASGRIGRGQARRADRGGADAAQHQCGCRERLAPRPDRAGDTRDRRSHLGRDHAGAGLSHRVGGCAGRGRCHLRRQSGRARGFLHAWLHQQPDQHALQRHQDRSAEHDLADHGYGQSRSRGIFERSGLADVGRRCRRWRNQLDHEAATHRADPE